jgi:hypothetical protein
LQQADNDLVVNFGRQRIEGGDHGVDNRSMLDIFVSHCACVCCFFELVEKTAGTWKETTEVESNTRFDQLEGILRGSRAQEQPLASKNNAPQNILIRSTTTAKQKTKTARR